MRETIICEMVPAYTFKPFLNGTTRKEWIESIIRHAYSLRKKEARERILAVLPDENIPTGIGAIPETTEYANGWNDCRKEAFKMLNAKLQAIKTAITSEKI